jgi:5-methylcytosine-specific restriction protein A
MSPLRPPTDCRRCKKATTNGLYCEDCTKIVPQNAWADHADYGTVKKAQPWSAWYDKAVWRGPYGLRRKVLSLFPICTRCNRNPATVADHIEPHRGDWKKFVSLANLTGLCKQCHDIKSAGEERTAA